mmetsp:Transcript_55599/g.140956  ORF Transcript_55599/g.140956 Transcript_55599/m.140956 type:complete len:102 (+) Transcript_55599:299-604(+)
MQAVLAVADVPHPGMGGGDGPQALGEKNSIWIHLDDPVVRLVPAVVDDPLPDLEKGVRLWSTAMKIQELRAVYESPPNLTVRSVGTTVVLTPGQTESEMLL